MMVLLRGAFPQEDLTRYAEHFDDDATTPLGVKEVSVKQRDSVSIHGITYVSPNGGEVPAYLVVPKGQGKFAAILWGHWLMPNSPTSNREEFLNEAVACAPAGVISLLIDAPQARPGFKPNPNPVLIARQVIDLRRGVDLLLSRSDVDPARIAYVGHSWDAGTGAILDAVDKRFAAFVFMGGPQSNLQYVLFSDSPRMVAARKSMDITKGRADDASQCMGRSRILRYPSWTGVCSVSVWSSGRGMGSAQGCEGLFRDELRAQGG
jgi:hypothetical protein